MTYTKTPDLTRLEINGLPHIVLADLMEFIRTKKELSPKPSSVVVTEANNKLGGYAGDFNPVSARKVEEWLESRGVQCKND